MIERCEFGLMVVDGREYRADLVIHPRGIKPNWWRRQGHELALADLEEILRSDESQRGGDRRGPGAGTRHPNQENAGSGQNF
jgi:hypothetical protein